MPESEARIAALPIWSGRPALAPLAGGISNLSYTATDATGKYVVRLTRDFPFHHVFRDREVMVSRAAHAAGFGPEIVHAEPGLMVSRFIDGRVLTAADVRASIPRIAAFLARFHRDMPAAISGAGFIFWVFHVNRDYVRQLREIGSVPRAEHWLAVNAELEAAQLPLPIAFGHHDLLPANLIDDGTRLWLIDYEYAGFGTAMFDLANLSSNNGFSHQDRRRLARTLLRRPAGRGSAPQPRRDGMRLPPPRSPLVAGERAAPRRARASTTPPMPTRISPGSTSALAAYRARFGKGNHDPPHPRADRRHRRRHHRLLDRLSSRARPQGGRRSARAGQAHLRLDLARGRPRRPAPLVGLDHPGAEALRRALQDASRPRPASPPAGR